MSQFCSLILWFIACQNNQFEIKRNSQTERGREGAPKSYSDSEYNQKCSFFLVFSVLLRFSPSLSLIFSGSCFFGNHMQEQLFLFFSLSLSFYLPFFYILFFRKKAIGWIFCLIIADIKRQARLPTGQRRIEQQEELRKDRNLSYSGISACLRMSGRQQRSVSLTGCWVAESSPAPLFW